MRWKSERFLILEVFIVGVFGKRVLESCHEMKRFS